MEAEDLDREDLDPDRQVDWKKQKYFVPKEGALKAGMLSKDDRPPSRALRRQWTPVRSKKPRLSPQEREDLKKEKQAQKEKNGGKTDAEMAHEARNAANRAEATAKQDGRGPSGRVPWYVQARQAKRAAKL